MEKFRMVHGDSRNPTPYPELNAVLSHLVEGAMSSVKDNLIGAYLRGSSTRSGISIMGPTRCGARQYAGCPMVLAPKGPCTDRARPAGSHRPGFTRGPVCGSPRNYGSLPVHGSANADDCLAGVLGRSLLPDASHSRDGGGGDLEKAGHELGS
jgi:hypothetical protein